MQGSNAIPRIQEFGDVPPRATFRRFRRLVNAETFALRMAMQERLFRPSEPVVAHQYDGRTLYFVNYRKRR